QELTADAWQAAAAAVGPPGNVATLSPPADRPWGEGAEPASPPAPPAPSKASSEVLEVVAQALRGGERCALLLGGRAMREHPLMAAGRIAAETGVKLLGATFPTRLGRGAGLPSVEG